MNKRSYFSVSYDLITRDEAVTYDLFVNASSVQVKQKFVRIFPQGEILTTDDLVDLKKKYLQLYVAEDQRKIYMKSLVHSDSVDDEEAVDFIKDSAIKYLHNVFDPKKEFSTEVLYETIEGCKDAVENMIDVLDDYSIDGLRALIGNLSGHDFYTYDHSVNVSMYCITILRLLKPNATRNELVHSGLGGLLHDLGKIKIPTEILNKPDGLSDKEYDVIKTHPDLGIGLLLDNEEMKFEDLDLKIIARVVHEHHENWDGTGYPCGVAGKDIHILARICAIADFFDAITTKRSYAEVMTITQALGLMEKAVNKKIDEKIFKVFAAHVGYTKAKTARQLKIADNFDPCMPHSVLPLEDIKEMFEGEDFGKIRMIENDEKKKQ
ncbi:MAG: HD-GYP domain-containing protein (c-di-GMP phosphodiesterase class II) [Bacteriovoracaceae bacterium]